MALSNDLVSKFVKLATNDTKETKRESTLYGTVSKIENGQVYVKLDGAVDIAEGPNAGTWSELPITDTVEVSEGNRVIVMIKNHAAVITSNLSTPSANKSTTNNISDKVTAAQNTADSAQTAAKNAADRITQLGTVVAYKTDTNELTAKIASIENLEADSVLTDTIRALDGNIVDLKAEDVTINGKLEAIEGKIGDLDVDGLDAKYAKITDLDVTNGNVSNLTSDVAEINTLIFGSATGKVVQAEFANQVITHIGTAQIKDAMIDTVSAGKLTALDLLAGTINTDKVVISSSDGRMQIADNTVSIKDANRVRVQIGKDASGDYSINIYDANGNLMFSEGGITDKAIKDAIIRNDMVANDANIHASKLNIDSLFEEINDSTNTNIIKSTKVAVDEEGQTLDVAFKKMATTELVDNLSKTVSSQGTQISANTEAIETKVWQQDINTAKNEMSTQYSTLEQDLNSFKTTVGNTYSTKEELTSLEIGGRNLFEQSGKLTTGFMGNYSCPETVYSTGEDLNVPSGQYIALTLTTDDSVEYKGGPYLASYHTGYIPKMMPGEIYTVSVWAKCSTAKSFGKCSIEFLKDVTSKTIPNLSTDWQRYIVTGTYNGNTSSSTAITFYYGSEWLDGDIFYISSPKIEKGNVATDWTPAPEDLKNEVDGIESRVTVNESSITQLNTSITSRVTAVETATQKAQAAAEVAQETVDNIQIGGRNLAYNTGLTSGSSNFGWYQNTETLHTDEIIDDVETKSGKARKITYEEAGCHGPYWRTTNSAMVGKNFVIGDKYTQSVLMKASTPFKIIWGHEGLERSYVTLTDSWTRYTFTTEATDTGTMQRGISFYPYPFEDGVPAGTILYIADYKMELGNRASDWTPAPEDMATVDSLEVTNNRIDTVDTKVNINTSLIEQLSDSISMLVTDANGASLMSQTENGWTFSTGHIQNTVNSISENLNTLTHEVGDVNSTVDILQQTVDDLGVLGEYIQITTYEDEPCIELGELDSDFKLRITNTRMMFTEGSIVLAYFTNQSFHSKKVVVEEELQQGGFVWKVRSNGNLGLVWKGGNS